MSSDKELFQTYAQVVVRNGWATAVVFFLEAHRPLAGVCGAGVTLTEPLFRLCNGEKLASFLTALTADQTSIDLFLSEISNMVEYSKQVSNA